MWTGRRRRKPRQTASVSAYTSSCTRLHATKNLPGRVSGRASGAKKSKRSDGTASGASDETRKEKRKEKRKGGGYNVANTGTGAAGQKIFQKQKGAETKTRDSSTGNTKAGAGQTHQEEIVVGSENERRNSTAGKGELLSQITILFYILKYACVTIGEY